MGGIKTDKKKKVLVVDDGEVNRALLEKVLRDTYTVLQAADGEQALELLWRENGTIAAVLLDLFMPVLDGYE
ncbi:MAG: response regulator, partial [Pygmaiobacter sp.]